MSWHLPTVFFSIYSRQEGRNKKDASANAEDIVWLKEYYAGQAISWHIYVDWKTGVAWNHKKDELLNRV